MTLLGWFVFWFFAMSFIEHLAHRHFMHRKSPFHKWFPEVYERHAILHHRRYYKVFNHEPDDYGRTLNIHIDILPSLPISLVLAAFGLLVSWQCSSMILVAVLVHHVIWNIIHEEMHDPKGWFFASWRLYRFLARYHWMHHRYPGKNYNVVLPLADFVWGTYLKPSAKDNQNMQEIGL